MKKRIGKYSYHGDSEGPKPFGFRRVLYHFPFIGDKLVVCKFDSTVRGGRFSVNGPILGSGVSRRVRPIFANGWEPGTPQPWRLSN